MIFEDAFFGLYCLFALAVIVLGVITIIQIIRGK